MYNVVVVGTYDTFGVGLQSGTYLLNEGDFVKGTGKSSIQMGSAMMSLQQIESSHGIMPQHKWETYEEYTQIRQKLRNSWNSGFDSKKIAQTPFRAVNNSGDLLSRKNYSCNNSSQGAQSAPGIHGMKGLMGGTRSKCDDSKPYIPAATCNPKFVADSSDYITFKKQQAHNRNYNDPTAGGSSTDNRRPFSL
jgi:hypothetical protein